MRKGCIEKNNDIGRKVMKRKLSYVLVLALALCGCAVGEQEDYLYFLFVDPLMENDIWKQAYEGFFAACEDFGVKCECRGPDVIDTAAMEKEMNIGILQHADGIITQGVVDAALIDKAYEKGIPVILVDSDVASSKRYAFMGKDFHEQAKLLLEHIEGKIGKKEKLIIAIQVAEAGFKIAQDQIDEIEHVFASHPGGYEIVSISESKSEGVRARKEWEEVMDTQENINVAINFAAESAQYCYEAISNAGKEDDVLIYGADDIDVTIQMIKEGKIDGAIVTSFFDYGYNGVKMLYDYNKGKINSDETIRQRLMIVDQNNVHTYKNDYEK